jgi:CRP-like cAMP-binding protein
VTALPDVLALTAALPSRRLEAGEVLMSPADASVEEVAVLVEGSLRVLLDDAVLAEIAAPGAFVGEIGGLLGLDRTATVLASEPSTVRLVGDPVALFTDHPELALELARQLAGRLHRLLTYLADAQSQYGDDADRPPIIHTVLGRLASRPPIDIEPGSDRSPDY